MIAERRKSEHAAVVSETRFRELFNNAADPIYISDMMGKLIAVNDQACIELGYSRDELLQMNVMDVDALYSPEMMEQSYQHYSAGTPQIIETRHRKKDGTIIDVEVNARLIEFDGQNSVMGVARNIAKRKKTEEELRLSEETFRNIVQASPMGIHLYQLLDENRLIFVGANPAADKLLGVDNRQFIGKTLEEAFPPLKETDIPSKYRQVARSGESYQDEQIEYVDGKISGAFEVHVFQMSVGKVAVLFNEITARKQAVEEREHLRQQLDQAQKMESVGRLAGGIAHDFNNMLGVILGHADLMLTNIDASHALYTGLRNIRQAAERSATLTRQLLAFARKQTIAPQILSINETVEGMLDMLQRLIGEDIDLAWHPGKGEPMVKMDPSQIDQLLVNLCVNARDAISDNGKITIETRITVIDEQYCARHANCLPGTYVTLSVSDNGRGMDAEIQSHLFEPFYTTKETGRGTGLGLATVCGIVQQNDGLINVYIEPGQGSTFRIYLPQYDGEKMERKASGNIQTIHGQETILLVEDEQMILGMTIAMLESLGYTILPATTPKEALRLARDYEGKIDLLLTDVIMPGMNGRDLANQLNMICPEIKQLFMSGYTSNAIAHHGVLNDGVHFIQKPFTLPDLAAKLRKVLN